MYGLVNKAIKDMVLNEAGHDTWKEICLAQNLTDDNFLPLHQYPDRLTYELIGTASTVLSIPLEDLIKSFGRYWIRFTADEGYGELMNLFGQNFDDCLANLNQMHARMGAMMPNLSPPKFYVTRESEHVTRLEYHSHRPGLGSMVLGLIEGLADKHETKVQIERMPRTKDMPCDIFVITKI